MPRPRDSYKQRVYDAETNALFPADVFKTLEETEEFIRKVLGSRWRKKRFPHCAILTVTKRHAYRATGGATNINLPASWSWTKPTALHETAHYLLRQSHDFYRRATHGREYCGLMLELVRRFMGSEAGKRLRSEYVKRGIPYRAKKRITPALAAQLQARGRELGRYRKKG